MTTLRAWSLLTLALLKRSAREGMVVRSLVSPPVLLLGTLLPTLFIAATLRAAPVLALTPDLSVDTSLIAAVDDLDWRWQITSDLQAATVDEGATLATDGHAIWSSGLPIDELRLEAILRTRDDSSWRLHVPPIERHPTPKRHQQLIPQCIALLYSLYAVAFGVGMLIRDREDGTLDAERTLAVPSWVHLAARWAAGAAGLVGWVTLNLFLISTLFPIQDPLATLLNSWAAALASLAIGLLIATPPSANFSSALTLGISAASALITIGAALPTLATILPLASITQTSGGGIPLGVSLLMGAVAVAAFGRSHR